MDLTKRVLWVLLAASACEGQITTDDRLLEWIAPLEEGAVPAGDAVELAVTTQNPDARVVRFLLDGREIGACDRALADEDCFRAGIWRWTVVIPTTGTHTITAAFDSISTTREISVIPPPTEAELLADEADIDEAVVDPSGVDENPSIVYAISRGSLDPSRGYHNVFGGISWAVQRQRVILHRGTPSGSVSAAAACMRRYGASIRHWADHYGISRGSVVATAITESSCTNPRGSSDGLSSGPMQVTASTCSALTGLSRSTCRVRMHTHPDFSFQVGVKYMASAYQRRQHHRDPPKIAAAYNAGSVRHSTRNRWHMLTTGNHIDRFVSAYNAYRRWEAQHGVALLVAAAEPRFEGEHVASVEELPAGTAAIAIAIDGQVVFVGDFAERDGGFWQLIDGRWEAVDSDADSR